MKEQLIYVDRRGTNCFKWDGMKKFYGRTDLLPMSIADMDFKTPQCVRDALKEYVDMGAIGYNMPSQAYFESFLNWEKTQHGVEIPREWLRFAPGVVVAISWLLEKLTTPGDSGIILTPVYGPFSGMLKQHGLELVSCPLRNVNGAYSIDFELFEQLVAQHQVKVFLLCSPHNPVGRVWRQEELDGLAEICRRHGVFIISDEIHQDILMPGSRHISILNTTADKERLAMLTSTAKSFNLAGVENAFMVLPGQWVRDQIDALQDKIATHSGNGLGYVAVTAAYTGGHGWLQSVRQQVWENYTYLRQRLLQALPKLVISPLEGTFLMWIDFAAYLQPGEEAHKVLRERCDLLLNAGSFFGGAEYDTCVRVNLATSAENVQRAAKSITENFVK